MTRFNEYDRLSRVALWHARDAFGDAARIERDWRALNFTAAPDYAVPSINTTRLSICSRAAAHASSSSLPSRRS